MSLFGTPFSRALGQGIEEVLRVLQENLERTFQSEAELDGPNYVSDFKNGWENYGGTFLAASFYKDPFGFTHLQGAVKSGTVGAAGVIWMLPKGYRPSDDATFAVDSNGAFGHAHINSDGSVIAHSGSNTHFSLDGILFKATKG